MEKNSNKTSGSGVLKLLGLGGCVRAEETELTFDLPLHPVLPLLEVDGSVVVDGHTHTNLGVHPPPNFE